MDNEQGVSEVVGAMLILLILVLVLGTMQAYEVPAWNKELEMQHFDKVQDDFLNLQSDIQDVFGNNIPKTSSLSMGVRYPQRYLLQNPGPGASGMLTFEPVNVTLKLDGNVIPLNSTRIIYEMQGISQQPKLVYEHGLVIRDFGSVQFNESAQSIVDGNNIFVPIIFSPQQSVSGMLPESLSILPAQNNQAAASTMNITLETKYPCLWRNLTNNMPGVNVSNVPCNAKGKIYINRSIQFVSYPIQQTGFYSGMITNVAPQQTLNVPPFTNIDINKPYYPYIQEINITENGSNHSNWDITAEVYNVSSSSQIHADLTDITENIRDFDVKPNSYISNNAKWYNLPIPNTQNHEVLVGIFWVRNNSMQFYKQQAFYKKNSGSNPWI